MVVQNKKIEKACCFYVSEFHLEMILVPYINQKIEENITILTEIKLKDTVEILISKMNLNSEIKKKILNLNWNGDKNIKEKSNIIIIGSKQFIEEKNKLMDYQNILSVLDCYDFNTEKENMNDIADKYQNVLNTLGKENF